MNTICDLQLWICMLTFPSMLFAADTFPHPRHDSSMPGLGFWILVILIAFCLCSTVTTGFMTRKQGNSDSKKSPAINNV